ncbi:MAG TPA: FRG domain-containing protein [Candidatus Saccharimonadales bacterium]|nr:FRG domain-containing protein [Candidatus Saccharimonadales bacterium]
MEYARAMIGNKNEISNVSEFLKRVKEIRDEWWSKEKDDPWMPWFRGHNRADWKLQPRLYRDYDLKRREKSHIEDEIREEFVVRAPALSHIKPADQSDWDWYFLMQHCGAPTRLLDWSEGALIGLYFAVRNNPGFYDAAVWVLDPYKLNERVAGKQPLICPTISMNSEDRRFLKSWLPDPFAERRKKLPSEVVPILPAQIAQRISSQRACFTIHGSDQNGLDKLQGDSLLIKIVIPAFNVVKIRRELEIYGIDEVTIFPDLDGLGRCVGSRWKSDRHDSPHEVVCTRIEPSKIHKSGVGVYAVTDIKRDDPLFRGDNEEMLWLDESTVKSVCQKIWRFGRCIVTFRSIKKVVMEKMGNSVARGILIA